MRAEFEIHAVRPDGDNLFKALADSLNGIIYRDDGQVAHPEAFKVYGRRPGVHVQIRVIEEVPAWVVDLLGA